MIAATTRVSGLSGDDQAVFSANIAQLNEKQPRNSLRRVYYEFRNVVQRLGNVVPPQYYQAAQALGWSAKAVDLVARRCNLDGFSWPGGDIDSLGSSLLWDQNRMRQTVSMAMTASLVHATSFLIVTKGAAGEPEVLVHAKDALSCTGLWNARTRSLDSALSITQLSTSDNEPVEVVLYLPNLTVTCERATNGQWSVADRQVHNLGVPVEPLVYRPQVWRPFGASRISRPVMSSQDAAMRSLVRMEGNADVYAFAQMILLGADSSNFKNPDGTLKEAWQVALGRIFSLPDIKELAEDGNSLGRASVQQFSAQSPQPHIDLYRQHAQKFSSETSIPTIYLGVDDKANPTSADALFIQDLPLIEESEGATDDWAPALSRTWQRVLQCAQGLDSIPDEWHSLVPTFRSPAYVTRAAAADAGTKIAAAIPGFADTEVGLEMMGLTPSQIDRFLSEKRRNAGRGVLDALRAQAASPQLTPPADGDVVGG